MGQQLGELRRDLPRRAADGPGRATSHNQPEMAANRSPSVTPRSGVGSALGFLICLAGLTACEDPYETYVAAADLTRQGFVHDDAVVRRFTGQTIRVWGTSTTPTCIGTGVRARFTVNGGVAKPATLERGDSI